MNDSACCEKLSAMDHSEWRSDADFAITYGVSIEVCAHIIAGNLLFVTVLYKKT